MRWRLLTNAEAHAAWKRGGKRCPFLEVTCVCGHVGVYRSKTFQRTGAVDVVCGGCSGVWRVVK